MRLLAIIVVTPWLLGLAVPVLMLFLQAMRAVVRRLSTQPLPAFGAGGSTPAALPHR